MAIGGFVGEALTEGLVFNLVAKIWKMVGGMFTDKVRETAMDKISTAIDPKTFEEEHFFARDLAEADLQKVELKDEREIFNKGMLLAEEQDRLNGTMTARNFRIIVAFEDKKENATDRPGIKIIEQIAKSCSNELEVYLAIQIVGAMHDPAISLEKVMHWAKDLWYPFLKSKASIAYRAVDCRMNTWADEISDDEKQEKKRAKEIKDMPSGLKKFFSKIGFELSKYIWS